MIHTAWSSNIRGQEPAGMDTQSHSQRDHAVLCFDLSQMSHRMLHSQASAHSLSSLFAAMLCRKLSEHGITSKLQHVPARFTDNFDHPGKIVIHNMEQGFGTFSTFARIRFDQRRKASQVREHEGAFLPLIT